MTRQEWLASLKAGDAVVKRAGWVHATLALSSVERTTATQVIVDGKRYSRDTGRVIGRSGSYSPMTIEQPSDENLGNAKRQSLLASFRRIAEDTLTTDQLERIVSIAAEAKKEASA